MKSNRKMKSDKSKYIDLLINTVNTDDFKMNFLTKYHFNYNDITYWGLTFYDVVTNIGINKLLRRISNLKKNKYKADLYLKVPGLQKLNYFRMQYDNSGYGVLAKIDFLKDQFINKVDIGYTQISNNEAIIEYKISFSKILTIIDFSNYLELNKKYFLNCPYSNYFINSKSSNEDVFDQMNRYITDAFMETVQSSIGTVSRFGIGNYYSLPTILIQNVPNEILDRDTLKNSFLATFIEIKNKNQYLFYDVLYNDGLKIDLLFTGKEYSYFSFLGIASRLRLEFYYFLFGKIEQNEINLKMNKYFGSTRKRIKSSDYKWLVNKIRAFKDNTIHQKKLSKRQNYFKDWIQYRDGNEVELDLFKGENSKNYESIYNECLNHIKTLYSLQKENLIIGIATWTLILTVISLVITFIVK